MGIITELLHNHPELGQRPADEVFKIADKIKENREREEERWRRTWDDDYENEKY